MNTTPTLTGRVRDCVSLSYRTPAESVVHLLPDGLELVTRGPWAFWNVVACRVEAMRPMGDDQLPNAALELPGVPGVGVSYHHVAYRLWVQAMNDRADVRRGLYFVRSDADAPVIGTLDRWMPDHKYHPAEIELNAAPNRDGKGEHDYVMDVVSADDHGHATLRLDPTPPTLAAGSCFPTMQDASEFLKLPPFTLTVVDDQTQRAIRIAEVQPHGNESVETPMTLREAHFALFGHLGQIGKIHFERATRVSTADCTWKSGRCETLLGSSPPIAQTSAEESFTRV